MGYSRKYQVPTCVADNTRPDLLVATSVLGSFQVKPAIEHVKGAKHLLQYIEGTQDYHLTLGGSHYDPKIEIDASFETTGDSKSSYGIAEYFGQYGAAVTVSKKISRVTHHPSEAEAVGIVEAIKKEIWIIEFNEELNYFNRK